MRLHLYVSENTWIFSLSFVFICKEMKVCAVHVLRNVILANIRNTKSNLWIFFSLKFLTTISSWSARWGHQYTFKILNSFKPSDAIWRQRTGSTLAQVMACCLTAPSHYLNQCWLIISKVLWRSCEDNFTRDTSAINHHNKLENYFSKFFSNLLAANELILLWAIMKIGQQWFRQWLAIK